MAIRRALRVWKDNFGGALVEFALVLPILVTLTCGTAQYALLLFTYNNMVNVARETSRRMSVGELAKADASTFATGQLVGWAKGWTVTAVDDVKVSGVDHVRTTIAIASAQAAILNLVPMPPTLSVQVTMRKEG